ncbi:hypothetical protein GCM10007939_03810 [Amylibacter marinus]|uniref:Uncharacterized protein n=1 Tax=Amylibacter marinus TaxID=1475483 RepID=A0ABQ5VSA1_9RHOB|nr:hypothetical protein [Amylibacter marinus]GLQ34098.1 hypothetical protein GCM10007939_03810 [Amylibacter marinus]
MTGFLAVFGLYVLFHLLRRLFGTLKSARGFQWRALRRSDLRNCGIALGVIVVIELLVPTYAPDLPAESRAPYAEWAVLGENKVIRTLGDVAAATDWIKTNTATTLEAELKRLESERAALIRYRDVGSNKITDEERKAIQQFIRYITASDNLARRIDPHLTALTAEQTAIEALFAQNPSQQDSDVALARAEIREAILSEIHKGLQETQTQHYQARRAYIESQEKEKRYLSEIRTDPKFIELNDTWLQASQYRGSISNDLRHAQKRHRAAVVAQKQLDKNTLFDPAMDSLPIIEEEVFVFNQNNSYQPKIAGLNAKLKDIWSRAQNRDRVLPNGRNILRCDVDLRTAQLTRRCIYALPLPIAYDLSTSTCDISDEEQSDTLCYEKWIHPYATLMFTEQGVIFHAPRANNSAQNPEAISAWTLLIDGKAHDLRAPVSVAFENLPQDLHRIKLIHSPLDLSHGVHIWRQFDLAALADKSAGNSDVLGANMFEPREIRLNRKGKRLFDMARSFVGNDKNTALEAIVSARSINFEMQAKYVQFDSELTGAKAESCFHSQMNTFMERTVSARTTSQNGMRIPLAEIENCAQVYTIKNVLDGLNRIYR